MKTIIKLILVLLFTTGFTFAQDLDAIFKSGVENLRARKYADCISDFKSYIAIEPNEPNAHYNLGICYANSEKHTQAVAAYREAVRLKPDYYKAYVYLGNELDISGFYSDAVVAYNKAIKLEPDNYLAHLELAIAHNNSSNYTLSMASYKTALRLDPDNTSAIYGIGLVYFNLKNKVALKKQIDILRPLDAAKADLLQSKLNTLGPTPPGITKLPVKPVVKSPQRLKDEKAIAAMEDLGFDAAFVTSVSTIRETATKTGKVLLTVKPYDVLSLTDKTDSSGFYRVIEAKSGVEGFIDGNSVVIKLTKNTENSGPPLNVDGNSDSVLADPVVSITNGETKTTLKIRLNGTLYSIPPQTTKIVSVKPGKFTYYGWSPGIRPATGKSTLEKGKKYSWNFKIIRRS